MARHIRIKQGTMPMNHSLNQTTENTANPEEINPGKEDTQMAHQQ